MSVLDVSIGLLVAGINLVAAVLLFTLRKQCVFLYGISLMVSILRILWGAATKSHQFVLLSTNVRGVTHLLGGAAISLAILLYARHLRQTGVLT